MIVLGIIGSLLHLAALIFAVWWLLAFCRSQKIDGCLTIIGVLALVIIPPVCWLVAVIGLVDVLSARAANWLGGGK